VPLPLEQMPEVFRGRRVLITGGLGFIGSNLARRLVSYGADLLLIDSMLPGYGGNMFNIRGIEDRVRVNINDMRLEHAMRYLVRDQEYIFNLAGQVSHLDSMADPFTDLEINCRSQLSLLEVLRNVNPGVKIVFAGTRQQYGKPDYLPVDERHLMHPTDVNGINKMAGEWYHIVYNNVYGIRACSLRLTNCYGPRQYTRDARQGFIGWFIHLLTEGREISIYEPGTQLRDFNYVEDVVDAFLLAAANEETAGQVYNLGGPPITHVALTELMIGIAGQGSYRLVPFPPERKVIDIGDVYSDYSKIQQALGWEPRVSLREGLTETLAYYRQHHAHYW
jgi:UDP-glucose 4-epimerase